MTAGQKVATQGGGPETVDVPPTVAADQPDAAQEEPPTDWPMLRQPTSEAAAPSETPAARDEDDEVDPYPVRHPRLPGYILPLYQTPPAARPTADTPIPLHKDDTSAPSASDNGWSELPTGPQPVIAPPPPDDPKPGRRRGLLVGALIGAGLALATVLASLSLVPLLTSPSDGRAQPGTGLDGSHTGGGPGGGAPNAVSGPLGTVDTAEFQLAAGVTAIEIRVVDTGSDLYRALTPPGSDFVPRVEQNDGQVRLRLARLYDTGSVDRVTVELNMRVRWRINMVAGTESANVDLRTADLAGVEFVGGVARIEMWLPQPHGSVPVRMSGGARDFVIHAPAATPVRVRMVRGAGTVTIDGATRSAVAAGTRVTPDGWAGAPDRYDIEAVAGVGTLTVNRY